MSKKVFTAGTIITAADANHWSNPIFDGVDSDGHHPKIVDAYLDPAGVLSKVSGIADTFKVTTGAGISVNIAAGSIKLPTEDILTKTAGNLVLPSDGVNFVYLDQLGAYAYSTILPPLSYPLAKVTTSIGVVSSIIDLRVPRITFRVGTTKVFGGQGGEKSLLVKASGTPGWDVGNNIFTAIGTSGTPYSLSGEHWFNNLTVEAAAYVTVSGGAKLYCTGTATIAGNISVSAPIKGGGAFSGTIHQLSVMQSNAGLGIGGGSGHNATASPIYNYFLQPSGSGGASSFVKGFNNGATALSDVTDTILVASGAGGNGGGLFLIEAGGTINVSGTISCNGGAATTATYTSGRTALQSLIMSGASGGSGGLIWLSSATSIVLTPSCLLEIKGGAGGVGHVSSNVSSTYKALGGGGGGGGYLVTTAPIVTTTGVSLGSQVRVDGGVKGASNGTGSNTSGGAIGGSFGGLGGLSDTNGSNGLWVNNILTPV